VNQWYVHSADGMDYRVGCWHKGVWLPGSKDDALREQAGLAEPGSYVWGKRVRP
jgi:hypothetical protein